MSQLNRFTQVNYFCLVSEHDSVACVFLVPTSYTLDEGHVYLPSIFLGQTSVARSVQTHFLDGYELNLLKHSVVKQLLDPKSVSKAKRETSD